MNNSNTAKKNISWSNIILIVVFFGLGYFFNTVISTNFSPEKNSQGMSLFWQVWNVMEEKYPFNEPETDEKIYGAIEGLVASYRDDYSAFLSPDRSNFFNETINGEFGGAGMEIGVKKGFLVVIAPLKGSAAEKAGVLPNDIITHVDGVDIAGDSLDEAINRIRGKIGTHVVLTVVREGEREAIDIDIEREEVHIPVLETEIIDDVFIIHLYNFNNSSEKLFKSALEDFKKSKKHQLLIDLRNNPGGYLESAVDIAGYFLPQGKVVVREQYSDNPSDQTVYRSKGYDLLENYDYELIVLINKGSASASEILAGALSEHQVALLVGEQSYGKGSVQELLPLPQGTSLKVTVAKWLTPHFKQISEIAISPKIKIKKDKHDEEIDTQLYKRVTLFNTQ